MKKTRHTALLKISIMIFMSLTLASMIINMNPDKIESTSSHNKNEPRVAQAVTPDGTAGVVQDRIITIENELSTVLNTHINTLNTLNSDPKQEKPLSDTTEIKSEDPPIPYAYVVNDPTFAAMKAFLASDTIDQNPYDLDTYKCWNYAADVIENAARQQIRCGFVYIEFTSSAHAAIAFNTIDKGLIVVDPQADSIVHLEVGTRYYQSIIPKDGYYYSLPNYDDTVKAYVVIW